MKNRMTHSAYHLLVKSIYWSLILHVLALLAMVGPLAGGLDMTHSAIERAAYISSHPWSWRLGWFPWQLTALSDLAVSLALHHYYRSKFSLLAIAATLFAIIPDQWGEVLAITSHIELASGGISSFLDSERSILQLTGTYGAGGYTLMSLAWLLSLTPSFKALKKQFCFSLLGAIMILLFGAAVYWNHSSVSTPGYPGFDNVYLINSLAFPGLLIWMAWMAIIIGDNHHRNNPRSDAQLHKLIWPSGREAKILNSHGLRDLLRFFLPFFPVLKSDITEVSYVNWLVPRSRIEPLLPEHLALDCQGDQTWISLLSFHHGNIGPRFLGPFRRFFPSPIQSNWRFYLKDEHSNKAVYFFKTISNNPAIVAGSRLTSDGLPLHFSPQMQHKRTGKTLHTQIPTDSGSAPDLDLILEESEDKSPEWDAQVSYLIQQNCAIHYSPVRQALLEEQISIPIVLQSIVPATVTHYESETLKDLTEGSAPLAFIVPSVEFLALGEKLLKTP